MDRQCHRVFDRSPQRMAGVLSDTRRRTFPMVNCVRFRFWVAQLKFFCCACYGRFRAKYIENCAPKQRLPSSITFVSPPKRKAAPVPTRKRRRSSTPSTTEPATKDLVEPPAKKQRAASKKVNIIIVYFVSPVARGRQTKQFPVWANTKIRFLLHWVLMCYSHLRQ